MNTLVHESQAEGPGFAGPDSGRLPRRPRRRYLNKGSLILTAAVTCAAGFYAGVRVEKGQVNSTGSASGLTTLASRLRSGAGAAGGTDGGRSGTGGGPAGLFGGGPGAAGGGGAGASAGTVASVSGRTLYVTDTSGNTIKVRLASSTKVTKSLGVSRSAVRPGDTVVVRGAQNARGTLVAATVSDSGNTSAAGTTSATGASGATSLGSLFSSGG